jgi:hypothetical protein
METHKNIPTKSNRSSGLEYKGYLDTLYQNVARAHKLSRQATKMILQTFPSDVKASLETMEQLYNDVKEVEVCIHLREETKEGIQRALRWAMNHTTNCSVACAGLNCELQLSGILILPSELNDVVSLALYTESEYAPEIITEANAILQLRNNIGQLPFEELVAHKTACEKRLEGLAGVL